VGEHGYRLFHLCTLHKYRRGNKAGKQDIL
jgi:hypothetical protein